jgi:hypothetical protein
MPMFIVALFTVPNIRNQCVYPLPDEWIKKMWYIYLMENYSVMRKNGAVICSKMKGIVVHDVKQNKTHTKG